MLRPIILIHKNYKEGQKLSRLLLIIWGVLLHQVRMAAIVIDVH